MTKLNFISLIIMLNLATLSIQTQTTCGNAKWWNDINANIVAKWATNDTDAIAFHTYLTNTYSSGVAQSFTSTSALSQGHCAPFFTAGTDLTCCNDASYKAFINAGVRASIKAAAPASKGPVCKAVKDAFNLAVTACRAAKAANSTQTTSAAATSTTNSTTSGGANSTKTSAGTRVRRLQTVSASVNVTISAGNGSGSAAAAAAGSAKGGANATATLAQLEASVDAADAAQNANALQYLSTAAVKIAQMLRGTLCAVCGDPDKASSLYDPSTNTWKVNQASLADLISTVAAAYNATSANGQDCFNLLQYKQSLLAAACPAAANLLTQYEKSLIPCSSVTDCQNLATQNTNPVTTGAIDIMVSASVNATSRRALEKRVLSGPTFQSTATGGATSVPDSTEDAALQIDGQSPSTITSGATIAQANVTTNGGTPNYTAVATAQLAANSTNSTAAANSSILSVLMAIITVSALIF